jgi:hypothetical protein
MLQAASDFICEATGFRKVIVEKPIHQHDLGALLESLSPPSLSDDTSAQIKSFLESAQYLETDLFTKAAKWADFISCKAGMRNGEDREDHGVYPSALRCP